MTSVQTHSLDTLSCCREAALGEESFLGGDAGPGRGQQPELLLEVRVPLGSSHAAPGNCSFFLLAEGTPVKKAQLPPRRAHALPQKHSCPHWFRPPLRAFLAPSQIQLIFFGHQEVRPAVSPSLCSSGV